MEPLIFKEPLIEGLILKRPNRFLMEVLIVDKIFICHCPCTCKIGNIIFNNIPCLLSYNDLNLKRKTKYTVEAISLNNIDDIDKKWIGINLVKSNYFVEYFLKTNQLSKIIDCSDSIILREQTVGSSKLDFLINDCYLEVKTPLFILPLKKSYSKNKNFDLDVKNTKVFCQRFFKHLDELSKSLKSHQKAILMDFYMFEANKFKPPYNKNSNIVLNQVLNSIKSGVEFWQINTIFEKDKISLKNYYKIKF